MRTEKDARLEIVEVLKQMWNRGHANTTGVSISEKLDNGRIIVDQSGTGFKRCQVTTDDLLVVNDQAELIEDAPNKAQRKAPVNVIIHTEYYRSNPLAKACVHCHAPYTQVFACEGLDIKPYTLQSIIMGTVPCVIVDDARLKEEFRMVNPKIHIPSGLHSRPDVFYVMKKVADAVVAKLSLRNDEMKTHGLAI
jgi:ribulose-5-phosphate 4-epimerase/fuculose-1-phosphate aldolase